MTPLAKFLQAAASLANKEKVRYCNLVVTEITKAVDILKSPYKIRKEKQQSR